MNARKENPYNSLAETVATKANPGHKASPFISAPLPTVMMWLLSWLFFGVCGKAFGAFVQDVLTDSQIGSWRRYFENDVLAWLILLALTMCPYFALTHFFFRKDKSRTVGVAVGSFCGSFVFAFAGANMPRLEEWISLSHTQLGPLLAITSLCVAFISELLFLGICRLK